MPNNFDFKLIVSLIAIALTIYSYFPYIRDILLQKTQPHLYTWLVWMLTVGTAAAGIWQGGGNYATFILLVDVIFVAIIFLFSFKYGTKNITRSDTIALVVALAAIVIWWKMESPLLAVLMVAVIDGLGYIPTFRKSFEDPWSETLSFWALMAISNILAIISIADYNLQTIIFPATLALANAGLWSICFFRRKIIKNSKIAT